MNLCRKAPFILHALLLVVFFCGCGSNEDRGATTTDYNQPIMEVNFDDSLGKSADNFRYVMTHDEDRRRYKVLKGLYEKNLPSKVSPSEECKIPKIIHQIWVGPKIPPAFFFAFQEKWKALHPDWEYHLWTENELAALNLDLKDLIDSSPNYGEKSDIIRAELLDRFGGVYLDVDMDPRHSLEELHRKYDFYAGIEDPHKIATTNCRLWLGISIMAACPHHPVIARWKELIRSRWDEVNRTYSGEIDRVLNHTYLPFSLAFFEKYDTGNFRNMTFPTTYFYPLSEAYATKRRAKFRSIREKCYDILENLKLRRPRPYSRVYPETLAVHYWRGSWQPTWGDQMKDMHYHVDFLKRELYRLQRKVRIMEKSVHRDPAEVAAEVSSAIHSRHEKLSNLGDAS